MTVLSVVDWEEVSLMVRWLAEILFCGSFNRTRSSYDYLAADADITFDR